MDRVSPLVVQAAELQVGQTLGSILRDDTGVRKCAQRQLQSFEFTPDS